VGFARIQYIEQPTARDLKAHRANVMHEASRLRPVVIDESLIDLESLQLAREMGYTGAALKACKGQSQSLLLAAAAQKYGMFLCVQDLTCPGASLLHSAGLAAHVPGVAAIESNARQYVPAANKPWEDRFPGIFHITDGTMETGLLTGLGLGGSRKGVGQRVRRTTMKPVRPRVELLLTIAISLALLGVARARAESATGPLRVLKTNPRYFTDGSGKAIYLAGSHNWHNFQDNGHRLPEAKDPPPAFDFDGYLDFLQKHNHNFFRLWRWEVPTWTDTQPKGIVKYCQPHPWLRSGPALAKDGKAKFDLGRYDPEYFARLKQRVQAAGRKGIYVSVMLFEGWAAQFTDAWDYHPFNGLNNVNAIDPDDKAVGYFTLRATPMGKQVLTLQEAYVKKVIDTVNDLDNVLYEICNESGTFSTEWQYHMIRLLKAYELRKSKQHPVGMTFQYRGGTNAVLYESPADWISPNPGDSKEAYRDNPSSAYRGKVIVNDTDHLWGHTGGDAGWVWKCFCRGLNVLFMEELTPSPIWQDSAREGMGQVRRFAEKMNLAAMTPADALTQTSYCLAERGREYLVFQAGDRGEFTVNLSDAPGTFSVEWFNITKGVPVAAKPIEGGTVQPFTTPFGGPAGLYLKRR